MAGSPDGASLLPWGEGDGASLAPATAPGAAVDVDLCYVSDTSGDDWATPPTPQRVKHLEARALSVNRWAEANNIVVVFPQKQSGEAGSCWDGYGDSGPDYDTLSGPQMLAIKNMIEAISGIVM